MRVLAESRNDGWTLMGRSGRDVTSTFPDLGGADGVAGLAARLGDRSVVVDGEIVVVDESGRPSFSLLQQRMNVSAPDPALVAGVPVQLLVFDLLSLDGTDATGLAYSDRRRLLEDLDLDAGAGGRIRVPPTLGDDPAVAWATAEALGLEGVVAKRVDAPYQPGRRSSAWQKVKRLATQEVVIVGWAEGEGRRLGGVGALLLAVNDPEGGWRPVGRVGTGFTDRMLDELAALLGPIERPDPVVADAPVGAAARGVHWVDPLLVGEVVFSEWTPAGTLRQPSWRGLRPDKGPAEVVVENFT